MQISKGFATWAGVVFAVGQYLGAVALFLGTLDDVDPLAGVAPLVTATGLVWRVIDGRMKQAVTLAAKPAPIFIPQPPSSGTAGNVTWTSPRPGAEVSNVVTEFVEPGDADALPEYETTEDVPPDTGDEHARPEAE